MFSFVRRPSSRWHERRRGGSVHRDDDRGRPGSPPSSWPPRYAVAGFLVLGLGPRRPLARCWCGPAGCSCGPDRCVCAWRNAMVVWPGHRQNGGGSESRWRSRARARARARRCGRCRAGRSRSAESLGETARRGVASLGRLASWEGVRMSGPVARHRDARGGTRARCAGRRGPGCVPDSCWRGGSGRQDGWVSPPRRLARLGRLAPLARPAGWEWSRRRFAGHRPERGCVPGRWGRSRWRPHRSRG